MKFTNLYFIHKIAVKVKLHSRSTQNQCKVCATGPGGAVYNLSYPEGWNMRISVGKFKTMHPAAQWDFASKEKVRRDLHTLLSGRAHAASASVSGAIKINES